MPSRPSRGGKDGWARVDHLRWHTEINDNCVHLWTSSSGGKEAGWSGSWIVRVTDKLKPPVEESEPPTSSS
ncbi:hypothetical protein JMJ77_0003553 [Colletotrichum scovillei]|uniref:Uncharacterized protein n=1 Tax=Colletotrichum scovillei TaxID=1209932 RepID=A0A9P7QRW2_9PEZI|nr:hypothetical protein JMJ78_0005090 [Colletotrichum scovillei]KAG7041447.1 hypothetical protein JMJ77_0003553 [Colletotrichum scovillei]KAG7061476.1 hypothetical protein JMJ76_0001040 [Colletotrichum scovillei]